MLMQCTYFSFLFLINLRNCDNSVFALPIWCMECVTVHTRGRIQEHADEDLNSNNSL